MKFLMSAVICSLMTGAVIAEAPVGAKDADGRWIPPVAEVPERFQNEVTPEYESSFIDRVQSAVSSNTNKGSYGNTYFENEKGSYPPAMFDVLFGNSEKGLTFLQAEDNQAGSWNSQTKGIDFFPSFTIKHQMRKYFLLGEHLDPAYKKRMYEGAKLWVEEDPMRRPTKYFKRGGDGWTPETKNSWVDVRNTDNLRAMRETSIYLMAEETGNEELRLAYKKAIQRYVWALWNIGMGEWDSENYHYHTFAPYVNLYDFAKDPEVKLTAKAALDMLSIMAAVKYFDGGWAGPIKRDYNKPYVFGGAAGEGWLYFGGAPIANPHVHGDTIHMITSQYRPPMAVVELAQKTPAEPVELFAAKPTYETWKVEGGGSAGAKDYPAPNYQKADHEPWVFETTYWTQTYQIGTLPQGSFGDLNGIKLLMRDSEKGAQFFVPASHTKPSGANRGAGKDKIAHYQNLVIMVTDNGTADWAWIIPAGARVEDVNGVRFISGEKTWLALSPINLSFNDPDGKKVKNWVNTQGMTGKGTGGPVSGFALEIGDPDSHGSYDAFKKAVAEAKLDTSAINQKQLTYTDSKKRSVGIQIVDGWLPKIWRNRIEHDPAAKANWALYRPADGGKTPLSLGWKEGKLHVESGGWIYEATYTDDHQYTWKASKK